MANLCDPQVLEANLIERTASNITMQVITIDTYEEVEIETRSYDITNNPIGDWTFRTTIINSNQATFSFAADCEVTSVQIKLKGCVPCTDSSSSDSGISAGSSSSNTSGSSSSDAQPFAQRGANIDGISIGDWDGYSISLNSDGSVLAIGAPQYNATFGAVRVFNWNGSSWTQKGNTLEGGLDERVGWAVSLSDDGNTLALSALLAEMVRIYSWNGSGWIQKGSSISGENIGEESGFSISLSSDGNTVAIGAPGAGLNDTGAARVYVWNGSSWNKRGSDINGEAADDSSGISVSLSSDGNVVAIGARSDGSGIEAGHVRVYSWTGSSWSQRGSDIDGEAAGDYSGESISLNSDGSILAIGSPYNAGGQTRVYSWNGSSWTQRGTNIEIGSSATFSFISISGNGNILAIGTSNYVRIYDWNGSSWTQTGADIDNTATSAFVSVSVSRNGGFVAIADNIGGSTLATARVFSL